jgi:elongation factor G
MHRSRAGALPRHLKEGRPMSPHSEPTHNASTPTGHVQAAQAPSENTHNEAAHRKGLRTGQIRNIALAGHAGAGKTTLLEALLLAGGAIESAGSIDRGNTVSDTDSQEKSRAHSIDSCVAHLDHAGCHLNLIDTAGHAEFFGGTLSALAAVETVAVVVNAINGIEHGTRELMTHARERGLARILVINKIDFDRADLGALVDALRKEFGSECLPVNLPAGRGKRVLDCFFHGEGATDFSSLADAHQRILDQVVEVNEATMGQYLESGEAAISPQQLHDAFEQCLREGHLVPICFVSARTGAGIHELLELAARLLPNPAEGNPPPFVRNENEALTLDADPSSHVIADVFKIANDQFLGKLGIFRVWQGTVRRNSQLFVDDGRKPFKVNHLFRVQGKSYTEVGEAVPGDILAVAKVDDIHFDAVLHDSHDEDRITLVSIAFPAPTYALALETKPRGQEQKLATALARLIEEDPCLAVEHHKAPNSTVIRGLSELHLRVVLERVRERYGVEVTTQPADAVKV